MKISRNWLEDYVDLSGISNEKLEELITTRVAEVDDVFEVSKPIESSVIAQVKSVIPHAESRKLSVVEVSTGSKSVKLICGASNCKEGIYVALALPSGGCFLDKKSGNLIQVVEREVAGVKSSGVLLSDVELDIGSSGEGLFLLESLRSEFPEIISENSLGKPLSLFLGKSDFVFEIDNKSLTHRPDLWGHFGFARELAAILDRPLLLDIDAYSDATNQGLETITELFSGAKKLEIDIKTDACRRFSAAIFSGLESKESPFWIRKRLHAVGSGTKNAIVDLSNYVMQDVSQPNHTYDLLKLTREKFSIRKASKGEKFVALDETELELSEADIVICDSEKIVALGGIIGGLDSSVTDKTTQIAFESANFDPVVIRKSAKSHNLRTDASNRFEKTLSSWSVPLATVRFAEIAKSVFKDFKIESVFCDNNANPHKEISVPFDIKYIKQRLGSGVEEKEIERIIKSLSFDFSSDRKSVKVPYYRATKDISIIEDLVEEVGRIYGYENIVEEAPKISYDVSVVSDGIELRVFNRKVRDFFSANGSVEIYNYSTFGKTAENLGYSLENAIELLNPVDATQPFLRTSLVPSMLESAWKNFRYQDKFSIFEIGRAFLPYEIVEDDNKAIIEDALKMEYKNDPKCKENHLFCLLSSVTGNDSSKETVPDVESGAEFYSHISLLKRLFDSFNLEIIVDLSEKDKILSWMHPYRVASVYCGGKQIGVVAEVLPSLVSGNTSKKSRICITEVNLSELVGPYRLRQDRIFKEISKFPESFFEMSVVVPERLLYKELEYFVESNIDREILKSVEPISVYKGNPLPEGTKSISVKINFASESRTLSSEELTQAQNKLMTAVEKSEFELRS